MHISIEYCVQWDYTPKAVSLADRLKEEFDVDCELIKGGGGIFEVKVDGELVYSKHQTGEFPDHNDLVNTIAKTNPT